MLAVVIPTRNRPDLVARAVASVATGVRQDITVVVSENSGPGANREAVAEICKRHGVPMIGPEGDLRMVEHWEWALREVLRHVDPTHVTFLTDRMVYRPQASEYLLRAMRLFPGAISVFNHDRIDDSVARIRPPGSAVARGGRPAGAVGDSTDAQRRRPRRDHSRTRQGERPGVRWDIARLLFRLSGSGDGGPLHESRHAAPCPLRAEPEHRQFVVDRPYVGRCNGLHSS
jgi:hypothetical protein